MPIAGVVMVGAPDADNRQAIERYGRVAVVGELPPLDPLTPRALWSSGPIGVTRRGKGI